MSDIVIRVDNLGKRYRIGGPRRRYNTLRESLMGASTGMFRRLRNQRLVVRDQETFWALKDVSFQVRQGEVVGIIGRNGAGKSTLLKILSRITSPTEGRINLHGRVGSLLEVGTGFHPELTGRENIYLNGAILGMKRTEIARRFDEIVAFADIETFLDTPAKHYSSGMYVRLAFAVAAYLEPEILIVDEVLAVGDAEFQKKCLGKMGDVSRSGRTILFVSHNMAAVQTLCTRALLLEDGKIVVDRSPIEAVRHYLGGKTENSAERIWDDLTRAPGCAGVGCCAVRIRDMAGNISSHLDIQQSFMIEIDFQVLQLGVRAGATVLVHNQEGVLVASSISNNDPNWHGKDLPNGLYRSVCTIPGNLLNDGHYSISVLLWKDAYAPCMREDDVVSFNVYDTGGVRGDYMGGWSGVIRPWLEWQTRKLT